MEIIIAKNQTDIESCISIRKQVFVSEQNVPVSLEVDEYDNIEADCTHFMIYDGSTLAGTFRIISENPGEAHLQRLCLLKEYRNIGAGRLALSEAEKFCAQNGYTKITLNAQCYAIKFYEKSGFEVVSGEFDDAGIPHVKMEKAISDSGFEKKKQLFLNQKKLLDTFLEKGAISKAQYDKSYGDLVVKMGMEKIAEKL